MAEFAVSRVIRCLDELLIIKGKHSPELRNPIEAIKANLRQIRSILQIAEAKQEIDEGIRNWVAKTREVAYDAEDLLLVAIASRNDGNFWRRLAHMSRGVSSSNLDQHIKVIDDKISALQSDRRVHHIKPSNKVPEDSVSRRQEQTITYSRHAEEDFVGLDEDINHLVKKLVNVDRGENYQLIAITGICGVGKTTMAKKIYHRADVRSCFHAFVWVCVNQKWEQVDILRRILDELEPEKRMHIQEMNIDELSRELYKAQTSKRCLIVLDDVAETNVWDMLRPAFPSTATNSKVLLTMREKRIASYVDIDNPCYIYEQRHLTENERWELLKKKVSRGLRVAGLSFDSSQVLGEPEDGSGFVDDASSTSNESFQSCNSYEEDEVVNQLHGSSPAESIRDQGDPKEMEKRGKEMVAICGGLPLTINVLGGLLMKKSTVSEWRSVHQNLFSYLRKGQGFPDNGRLLEVLALSYHNLPYQLKQCFLHLGTFAEDSKIPTRKLYELWAAEGFLSQDPERDEEEESIKDIGERYLGELVLRCMVQVKVDDATGRFKSCRLHDAARELCVLKGNGENFLKKVPRRYELELIGTPSPSPGAVSSSIARRLCISVDDDFDSYFPPVNENLERMRSALFFSRLGERRNLQPTLEFLCEKSKLVRVLDVERFDFGVELLKSIGDLIHLKYLSFRGSQFYKLPSSIGNLKYLETLDLRLRIPFLARLKVPNVIHRLNSLKHLYLPSLHRCSSKLQLDTLSKLEILKNFDTRVSDYRDIRKLTKLQKLKVSLSLDIDHLVELISRLKLEHGNIRDSSFLIRCDFQADRDLTVLKHLVGLVHLRKLDLNGFIMNFPQHFDFSGSLHKLTLRNTRLKEDPVPTLEKLPNLYSLILRRNASEGTKIYCSGHGFPRLRYFEVQGLDSLEYWTIEERAMPNIHCMKIDECNNLKEVPEGINFLTSLRQLVIANMPEAFKSRVRKLQGEGGEEISKIEHISSIKIIETGSTYQRELERQVSGSYNGTPQTFSPSVPEKWKNR